MIKKVVFTLNILVLFFVCTLVNTKAVTEYDYVDPRSELRAVWVSPITDGNVVNYTSETQFKSNMEYIFTILEENNLNTLIFHVRQMNDALYDSELNPVYSGWSNVNFASFDPLAWLINECHNRGIEFHAWMNPYRIASWGAGSSVSEVTSKYTGYPSNAASKAENVLLYNGKAILNPGCEEVRTFVVDTVMEFLSKYDVDAIHFDDYFYIGMEANGAVTGATTILNEADNNLYESFCDNFNTLSQDLKDEYLHYGSTYSNTSASNKANWRRVQCNLFFKKLNEAVSLYNSQNNKYVQIGVAPTGIYKNGNGAVTYDQNGHAITTGSKTGGQTHYSSYLFCDSLYWCEKEWIDYIMPQSYWAIGHTVAGYHEVMGWWNKVVKNLNVNLYSGIGLYMADSTSNTYTWQTDTDELYKQLQYLTTLENASGASIYNFAHLRKKHDGGTSKAALQAGHLGVNCWKEKIVQPEIKSFDKVSLGSVNNFTVNDKTLTWDKLDGAKFYAIYRSSNVLTFDSSQLVDVVGGNNQTFTWTDSESGLYHYGIKALSYTNTLGEATTYNLDVPYLLSLADGASIRTEGERQGLRFTASTNTLDGSVEHGFYLAIGTHSLNDFVNAINSNANTINGNKLLKKQITGSGNTFNVVVYNIPELMYDTNISAIAYIKYLDSNNSYVYQFSSNVVTRNILEVAIKAYTNGENAAFINSVCSAKFNKTFNVTRFAAAYVIGTEIYIANNFQFNQFYDKEVALKYNPDTKTYVVVQAVNDCTLTHGTDYDLLIAVHSKCDDKTGSSIVKAMKVGDIVIINIPYETISAYSSNKAVSIKVMYYTPN